MASYFSAWVRNTRSARSSRIIGLWGRNHHHFQAVDALEFIGLGIGRSGHSRQLVVKPEIVLEGNRGQGLVFALDRHRFLGFDRLVQTLGPAPASEGPAGKFIDDHDFAVADDCNRRRGQTGEWARSEAFRVCISARVVGVVKAFVFLEHAGLDQQLLDLRPCRLRSGKPAWSSRPR